MQEVEFMAGTRKRDLVLYSLHEAKVVSQERGGKKGEGQEGTLRVVFSFGVCVVDAEQDKKK